MIKNTYPTQKTKREYAEELIDPIIAETQSHREQAIRFTTREGVLQALLTFAQHGPTNIKRADLGPDFGSIVHHVDSKWYECWYGKFDRKPAKRFKTLKGAVEHLTGTAQVLR